ncbi:hypothetical protein AABB24_012051 [Solanum stoloniferum]|uniref:Uncharacterized protein n=1 Tax=Solanum stoloniferum TaxID=62892 RepID=A0ABD2UFK0_9SOLN
MGVLQRISIGYLFASILEIWFANDYPVDSSKAFIRRYFFQALAGILIGLSYLILVYGLYVPDWFFEISSLNMESRSPVSGYGSSTQTVNCGVRGSLEPPCNVVGLIDRLLLGEKHLYQRPVYRRTKECSVNSPDYGPPPSNAPGWCLAPFDPEGILSHYVPCGLAFWPHSCACSRSPAEGNLLVRIFCISNTCRICIGACRCSSF